jgi:hypothetical protein
VRALAGRLYALTSGKVFLVSNQWDSQLSKLAVEFRDKKVFRGTWHAHEIHLRVSEGEHAGDLTLTRVGEQWQVKNALFPISNSAVDQYLTMLENFRVVSYHDELSTDAHVLKERQLDQPLLTLTAANDKNRFELRIAAGQAKGKLTRSSEFDENERSVLSSDVNVIGTVFKTSITSLEKSLEDFYDKQKSFTFNSDDSAAIVVRSSSPAYDVHLEKKSGAWVDAKGAPATTVVASFLTKLKALQVGHFFDAKEMAQSKSRSSLELRCDRDCVEIKNTKGEVVFALNWQMPSGKAKESTSDKAKSNGAWVVAKTNLTRPVFGLSEPAISALLAILSEQKMAK